MRLGPGMAASAVGSGDPFLTIAKGATTNQGACHAFRVTIVTHTPRWLRPAVDYGPLAAFFLTYLLYGLMAATAVVVVASIAALGAAWAIERRVPLIPLVTAAVVAVFGGLTLWLQDETFIKMKPTIVQALFAAILLGGLGFGRPLLKPLLGAMMPPMSDSAWSQLTLRYALFFVAMALLNEAGLAHPVDGFLGQLQGVRPAGADRPVHPQPDAVPQPARRARDAHRAGGAGDAAGRCPRAPQASRPLRASPLRRWRAPAPRAAARWRRPRRPAARRTRPRCG